LSSVSLVQYSPRRQPIYLYIYI